MTLAPDPDRIDDLDEDQFRRDISRDDLLDLIDRLNLHHVSVCERDSGHVVVKFAGTRA